MFPDWCIPCRLLLSVVFGLAALPLPAQESPPPADQNLVAYPRAYFDRFQPLTALDMVRQVPGFSLENNNSARGYGEALGNLLIDDRRPAAKQDQPVDILARIPATRVERIELIRGPVRDIDMLGQSILVNVVLIQDTGTTLQWEAYLRKTFNHGDITPRFSLALAGAWLETDYEIGAGFRRSRVGDRGSENQYAPDGDLIEERLNDKQNRNSFITGNLAIGGQAGATAIRFSSSFTHAEHLWHRRSDRYIPDDNERRVQLIHRNATEPVYEAGLELERELTRTLAGRLVILGRRDYENGVETQQIFDGDGNRLLVRIADTYNYATEGIVRTELDWAATASQMVQLNIEGAYNRLDGKFSQTDNRGDGPFSVTVPGANSLVEERRADFALKDILTRGTLELDAGLGAEVSRLTQSGDFSNDRNFFYLKPHAILTWTPESGRQTRLRLAREVSQLNLADFISATVFEDDDLALGNPDIRPDRTWKLELSHEHRFNRDTVLRFTLYRHWIRDVLDLLPLDATHEAPGNIGNGTRQGVMFESTLPLRFAGLNGARLRTKLRWQDSSVTDPVTGERRILSAIENIFNTDFFSIENRYAWQIDYRQDFETQRAAWGFVMQNSGHRYRYKVNELEVSNEGTELNAYIETTRWQNIRVRFDIENVLDYAEYRDRTLYTGERGLTPVLLEEHRKVRGSPRIYLTLSGTY